jgi:hypothetical protein
MRYGGRDFDCESATSEVEGGWESRQGRVSQGTSYQHDRMLVQARVAVTVICSTVRRVAKNPPSALAGRGCVQASPGEKAPKTTIICQRVRRLMTLQESCVKSYEARPFISYLELEGDVQALTGNSECEARHT